MHAYTYVTRWRGVGHLSRWNQSDDVFELGTGEQQSLDNGVHLPVLQNRLFLTALKGCPVANPLEYYLTLNQKLRYVPFCADFGACSAAYIDAHPD